MQRKRKQTNKISKVEVKEDETERPKINSQNIAKRKARSKTPTNDEQIAALNICFIKAAAKQIDSENDTNLNNLFEQYSKFYNEIMKIETNIKDVFSGKAQKKIPTSDELFKSIFGSDNSKKDE